MTRAVLYANSDMEPITVMDVPQWGMAMLERGERVFFVPPPTTISTMCESELPSASMPMVSIWGEMFARRGQKHMFLFTDDDEIALLLRAELLPGQQGMVKSALHAARSKALVEGFMKGIEAMRRRGDVL